MKMRFNHLTLILSLSVFTLILFSCDKEEIKPNTDPTVVTESDDTSDVKVIPHYDEDLNSKAADDSNPSSKEEVKSFDADARPELDVSIMAFPCFGGGNSLLVYNKNQPSLDFYNSDRFLIRWYKNGRPFGNGPRLECVCEGNYGVAIVNSRTGEAIGKDRHRGQACDIDEVIITKLDNN